MRLALLLLVLCTCKAAALWEPVPTYVWGCVKTQTLTVTFNGQSESSTACVQWDWVRKVDSLPRSVP